MVNTGVGSGGAAAPGAWAADAGADGGSRIMAPRTSPLPGPPRARTEDDPACNEARSALADHNSTRGPRPAVDRDVKGTGPAAAGRRAGGLSQGTEPGAA